MSAFEYLIAKTDRESLTFTYDVRKLVKLAETRSEVRRIEAMVSSATMELNAFADQLAVLRQTYKD